MNPDSFWRPASVCYKQMTPKEAYRLLRQAARIEHRGAASAYVASLHRQSVMLAVFGGDLGADTFARMRGAVTP